MLGLGRVSDIVKLVSRLSMDWQSLLAEEAGWEERFPNPAFLGAWREHRTVYGYTLRSELVYQLKKGLEERDDFDLEGPPDYLLVDEYQDLNRCDLAICLTPLHAWVRRFMRLETMIKVFMASVVGIPQAYDAF